MQFMFFFDISTGILILYCQYGLGFTRFLVDNGFYYFFIFVLFNYLCLLFKNCIYTYF